MEIAVITGSSAPEKSKPPSIISDDHIRKRRLYPRPGRFRCTDGDLGQTRPRFGSQNPSRHWCRLEHHVSKCLRRPRIQEHKLENPPARSYGTRR
ncbi:hypothetical protein PIB30_082339 [Stylosanthes scabra]|uniref:Uncharacterized protein n=1 Tax=Stylosanthes scabra TaxID=79078 RepID=A0ABU6YPJ8_9FABA|nr:hypothetical protein [Stylosanthes scabra]